MKTITENVVNLCYEANTKYTLLQNEIVKKDEIIKTLLKDNEDLRIKIGELKKEISTRNEEEYTQEFYL